MTFLLTLLILVGIVDGLLFGVLLWAILAGLNRIATSATK